MSADRPIQIDLRKVLSDKMGSKARLIPSWLVGALERYIHAEELNAILRDCHPARGAEFCRGVMRWLGATVTVVNPQAFPPPEDRRMIIVSNHPLGGLDGVALIRLLADRYGDDIKFVVNDLLTAVEPLSDVFLPVNKHGRQDRDSIRAINDAMAGDGAVMVFPAGLVSRLGDDGTVRDLQWHKMFVMKAVQYHRDVLPLYFSGENTPGFYRLARRRQRSGLKFNIEMLRLPAEMLACRDRDFSVVVGEHIPWQQLRGGDPLAEAARVRESVYALRDSIDNC